MLRWVVRLGGPHLGAEDVAHDVFLVAIGRIHTLRPGVPVEPWLFGITRRVVANARRRVWFRRVIGLEQVAPLESPEAGGEVQLDRLRRRRLVQTALDALSADHREVVVLADLEGRPAPEVAEMLGISVGTVYSRLHHARRNLADRLGGGRETLQHAALRQALREDEP